jgi:3',5'-cyclic-AMP phosphodiesterase
MTRHEDHDAERFDAEGNTRPKGSNYITQDLSEDGVDRRGFLRCMAWAGTATVWGMVGGVPKSFSVNRLPFMSEAERKSIFFVQVSDSHIGFSKEANKDVTATLQEAVMKVNALPQSPALVLHTGDITQLAKDSEFDTANEVLKGLKTDRVFYVPGEHDVATDNGVSYLQRYGKGTYGGGWHSFDHSGVHFIGLVNVLNLKAGGLGTLGAEQIAWMKKDVAHLASSTPIVVFAHVPLWTVYPEWGWGTEDSEQALGLLKRFGSVTVLNGHIHQIMQKIEGNVTFHTAMSTAFPQPAPGAAPSPGPMKVANDRLRSLLGVTDVIFKRGQQRLAIIDKPLQG